MATSSYHKLNYLKFKINSSARIRKHGSDIIRGF